MDDVTLWPDLASRALAGSVLAANDELFAEKENLIRPTPSTHDSHAFGHKGKVYDGWETRRRRSAGNDWAVVRLGAPGIVHGVVVDTAFFRGNYPPEISVEGACIEGNPDLDTVLDGPWHPLVPRSPAQGDTRNVYRVDDPHRWTHVRLSIYPDGGVARFRVHGEVVPDPQFLTGTVDLAAAENGGLLVDCSNAFYSSPAQMILPGQARIMGDGWENSRRRQGGNDHATFRLAGAGVVRRVEMDTSYFLGNAPGWAQLSGTLVDPAAPGQVSDVEHASVVVPKAPLLPDTRNWFLASSTDPVSQVRLDVYPDGGLARLRVWGELTEQALAGLRSRWDATRPG